MNLRDDITNYGEGMDFLDGKSEKGAGNNTTVFKGEKWEPSGYVHDDWVGITLHNTTVVELHADGNVVLNSGGWHTVTTKDRMNRHTPRGISVFQSDHEWYVRLYGRSWDDGRTVPFHDGMTIPSNGIG